MTLERRGIAGSCGGVTFNPLRPFTRHDARQATFRRSVLLMYIIYVDKVSL